MKVYPKVCLKFKKVFLYIYDLCHHIKDVDAQKYCYKKATLKNFIKLKKISKLAYFFVKLFFGKVITKATS